MTLPSSRCCRTVLTADTFDSRRAITWWRMVARRAGITGALCVVLGGCAVLDKPVRQAVYDFGPGARDMPSTAGAGLQAVVSLPEVEAGSALDSTAVLYRLAYADPQQLLPYANARWSMTPAQLVRQQLRQSLGQRRAVLTPGDGNAAGAAPVLVLRVELEEFSQLFDAPGSSVGLVRLRATATSGASTGDKFLGQRSFVVQRPAPTADAPGGVRALTAACAAVVEEIEQWLLQFR